jgi:aminoglycoside/choline kinase family phosphotransferase
MGERQPGEGAESLLARRLAAKVEEAFGADAELSSLLPLAGDASSRRYYRATLKGRGSPPSIVIMELSGSPLPLSSEELAIFPEPPAELPFLDVHRLLGRLGVRVPAVYGEWVADGILFLEDLGDRSLWDFVQGLSAEEVFAWYAKAIDQLLRIQSGAPRPHDSCIAFRQRFDFRLYQWEFEHFLEYGLSGKEVPERERERLRAAFGRISRFLDSRPASLAHRDFHSWNLMVHRGEIAVIDFQDALMAPLQYDLASLLNDRETDRVIGPELEQRLIGYYLERLERATGQKPDRDEFLETYILSAIQRDFKVVGRFRYLEAVKGKPGYRRYLPATIRRLKRNLGRLDRTREILPIVAEYLADSESCS